MKKGGIYPAPTNIFIIRICCRGAYMPPDFNKLSPRASPPQFVIPSERTE